MQTWANYGPPTLVETSMYSQTSVFERLAVREGDDLFFFLESTMSTRGIRSIYGGLVLHEADAGYCKILSTDPRPLILGQCGPRPALQSSVRPAGQNNCPCLVLYNG